MNRQIKQPYLILAVAFIILPTLVHFDILAQSPQILRYTANNEEYRYLLYGPEKKNQDSRALLIYLHGTASRGNNIDSLKKSGIPKLIDDGKNFNCYIAAPQIGITQNWSVLMLEKLISNITAQHPIDPDRIYILGISSGGAIGLEYTTKHPEKIACIVTISSWGNPQEACKMKDVPAWFFHAQDDPAVSIKGSKSITEALYLCRGNVRLTEFPDGGHNIWDQTAKYPQLFEWMFSKNKKSSQKTIQRIQLDQTTVGYRIPKALNNVTGIWSSADGQLFGINGKRSSPHIVNFDTLGQVSKLTFVLNSANLSWQDITPDKKGNLYIGDFGNENFKREFFQLYKISEQELLTKEKVVAKRIEFTVSRGTPLNYQASFYYNQNMYLFGESNKGEKFLVEVPTTEGDSVVATILGNCNSLMTEPITSAHYDDTTNSLFLLTKNFLGILVLTDGTNTITGKTAIQIKLPYSSQKEALTLLTNGYIAYADKQFLGSSDGNFYIRKYP